MTAAIVLSSSVLAVLLVAVLVREIRRRRALQGTADWSRNPSAGVKRQQ